jgi:hypothetical protein
MTTVMGRLIVGNVDCEAQCGEPERRDLQARWDSTTVAHRLLWLCQSEYDLLLMPAPISEAMMEYAADVLSIPLGMRNQVSPRHLNANGPTLLTEGVMADWDLHEHVQRLRDAAGEPEVAPYFVEGGLSRFCQHHELAFPWPDSAAMEPLNRKSFFRTLAEKAGIPIARGRICKTKAELEAAINDLIADTGSVIVKQDLAGGGEGNVAVTTNLVQMEFLGTSATYHVAESTSRKAIAADIFATYSGLKNNRLIVETYHTAREVIYSEVWAAENPSETWLINWGRMLMEPTWIGFEIPSATMTPAQIEEFTRHSLNLARLVGQFGYRGRMNCDAVLYDGGLFFTEINVRLGGCTHIDVLARRLLGPSYDRTHVIKTRNSVKCQGSFSNLLQRIGALHFERATSRGVLVLAENLAELGEFECMCVGTSAEDAAAIEAELLVNLKTSKGKLS